MSGDMLTQTDARERLDYDPQTGKLVWRVSRRHRIGSTAGCIDGEGYCQVTIGRKQYRAHRLIWLWMTGEWPSAEVDHINGDRADNRWDNLRAATRAENGKNYRKPRTNTSGYKGVYWHKGAKKWVACIRIAGAKQQLGAFSCPELAALVYSEHAAVYHGEFARER